MPENLHFLKDIVDEVNSSRDPCRSGFLTPSGLRRVLLLMIRGHWSSGKNHGPDLEDSLSCLEWNPDKKERQVDIELAGTEGSKEAGDSAIFLRVGNFAFRKVSFGAISDISEDNATIVRTYPCKAQVVFVHENPNLDVAFDMAWSTFSFISGYAEALTEILGQEASITPSVVGEPQKSEDTPTKRYRVDFAMEIELHISVSTTQESHRLKRAFDQYTN